MLESVGIIASKVKATGDKAIIETTLEYDEVSFDIEHIKVSELEINNGYSSVSNEVLRAIKHSIDNHKEYNINIKPPSLQLFQTKDGATVGRKSSPLESVGLYIPSGKGSYPSTLITTAVPAIVAGVKKINVIIPPLKDGRVDASILAVCKVLGIENIFRANGVAGICALAYGTESIPKVDKIVGPGGPYVIAAQLYAQLNGTSVGLLYGPSECLIVADNTADPELVAADLINEAEHGRDSSAILVTDCLTLANRVNEFISLQIQSLPELRKGFANSAIENYGGIILVDNMDQAIVLVNDLANEHVQVATTDPWSIANKIVNASEILIGQFTTFSSISYALGVPACLPTGQFAKVYSGVTVDSFMKYSAVAELDKRALQRMSNTISTLSEYEGFIAHKNSIEIRKKKGLLK